MAEVMSWIKSLSNDDLAHQLMNDHGYKCGPITVGTRSVYEKKLHSFKTNTNISGKPSPGRPKANGSSNNHADENDVEVASEAMPSKSSFFKLQGPYEQITGGRSSPIRKGRKSLPVPSPSKRSTDESVDDFVHVGNSRAKGTMEMNDIVYGDDEDLDPAPARRSSRRVTITSPVLTPKLVTSRKPTRVSTPRPAGGLSAYSSAEEDEEDVVIEGSDRLNDLPSAMPRLNKSLTSVRKSSYMKSPKSVTPTAQTAVKVRTSTPIIKMTSNASVFGNSAILPGGRRSTPRIPSSMRVEPPSASSLAGFSDDNDSENENLNSSPSAANLLRFRPRSSGVTRRFRTPLANITTQSQDLPNQSKSWTSFLSSSASSSPSSWISLSILIVSILFFISIFSFFFYSRITNSSVQPQVPSAPIEAAEEEDESRLIPKIRAPTCTEALLRGSGHLCLKSESHIRPALMAIKEIAALFEKNIIEHFCSPSDENNQFSDPTILNVKEVKNHLVPLLINSPKFVKLASANIEISPDIDSDEGTLKLRQVGIAFNDALTLVQLNPRFKMDVLRSPRDNEISHLKIDLKTFPVRWPFMCRITMTIFKVIWVSVIAAVIGIISVSLYYFVNLSKKRRSEEEDLKYELIEKSLELLQSPDEPQSMPILHIRDTLISPLDRKDPKNIRIWNQVVKFIEENESRVKIDSEVIEGETYRTWKWVATQVPIDMPSPSTAGTIKTGNIEWQGSAFNETDAAKASPSSGKSSPKSGSPGGDGADTFRAPTIFIKARNFFDINEHRHKKDSAWQIPIKEAILEKCALRNESGDPGIVHMVLDADHPREALVFMKCKDLAAATNAYLALHGWWCEKRLVSVRFLKEQRYYQRFPEAINCITTLPMKS